MTGVQTCALPIFVLLEQDDVLRNALGKARDEDYIDYFVRCKRREWQQAHEQITKWEVDRYLQLS